MKFYSVILVFAIFYLVVPIVAQVKPTVVTSEQSAIFGVPSKISHPWKSRILNYTSSEHAYAVPTQEILDAKKKIWDQKRPGQNTTPSIRSTEKPKVGINFSGNIQGSNVPPDNSMAISTNGFIVSAINSNIIFANSAGKVTFTQTLADFYTLLTIGSGVYDPRIIYDAQYNRFIALALHGNTPQTTKIVIAFSKNEDPAAGWYYYNVDGNPLGDNHWYDYPNVGLTQRDLFFSGLMRDNAGDWQYSILFQIDKASCFSGSPMVYGYYTDLNNADGQLAFNLVPAHNAWNVYPDSVMHLVSNVAQGGNQYHLHKVTGAISKGNAEITALQVTGPATQLAPDGVQPNTNNVMNTFDSRIWNAMELNGTVHFGAHVNSPNNTSALFYGRFDLSTLAVTGSLYYQGDYDYGFPSIAAFGDEADDSRVLINFLKTGPDLFPSQGAVICDGSNDVFDWGEEVMVKLGTTFVNVLDGNRERWGDYTTVSRRFFNPYSKTAEVWTTGCFGRGSYGTWITQYLQDSTAFFEDFVAEKTTLAPTASTQFSLVNGQSVRVLSWNFEGGSPASSVQTSPTIKYNQVGSYDVTLTILNERSNDTLTYLKKDYITVMEPIQPPVANFSVNRDTIYQGESVQFVDLSTNDPVDYSWTFSNGIPSLSKEKEPVIRYEKKGSHYVNLSVRNIAGNDNEIKQKFITVLEAKSPLAEFVSDKQVAATNEAIQFTDLSQNVPTSWKWYFPGASTEVSTEAHPVVQYSAAGSYDVSLVVQNFAGKDSIVKQNYIQIGGVGINETESFVQQTKLFPNPVGGGELTVEFTLDKKRNMVIEVIDNKGSFASNILQQRIKAGRNALFFSTETLVDGSYILLLRSTEDRQVKAIPFVVSRR